MKIFETDIVRRANQAMRDGRYDEARSLYQRGLTLPTPLSRQCDLNLKILDRRVARSDEFPKDLAVGQSKSEMPCHYAGAIASGTFRVDVIIPVFNALSHVQQCLAALETCRDDCEVNAIVVNDGSDLEVRLWLESWANQQPFRTLINHTENKGYTKAVNSGIKASTAQFLVLLNSDTQVTPGWLRNCLRCLLSDPNVGLVGPLSNAASWQSVPKIKNSGGDGFEINEVPVNVELASLSKVLGGISQQIYPRVKFLNGFCLMFRREVVDSIGLFDEQAFPTGYGEENDFCLRAVDKGFGLAVADDAFVFHAKSKSFGHEKRILLSKAGGQALRDKHGAETIAQALDETEKAIECLSPLRQQMAAYFADPERFSRYTDSPSTVDPIAFSPKPSFGLPDFNLDPVFSGPALVLPYQGSYVSASPGLDTLTIGVHLHLYYGELLSEFVRLLGNIPVPFDLYVSVTNKEDEMRVQTEAETIQNMSCIAVEVVENRGRDIAPFVATFGGKLGGYDLVCHMHSKKSPHNLAKRDWRRQLLHNQLGSRDLVTSIFNLFVENPALGMVFPEYHWSLKRQIGWGTNFEICKSMAGELGFDISPLHMKLFPAGSMFWARGSALAALWSRKFKTSDFPEEAFQVDGTPAHAIERLFGEIVSHAGFQLLQVAADKAHNLKNYFPRKWPYPASSSTEQQARVYDYIRAKANSIKKVPVFTAITGGYEKPIVHEVLDPWAEYVLFSDTTVSDPGCWLVQELGREANDPLTSARLTKASADRFFKDSEFAIWIDANVLIRNSLGYYLGLATKNSSFPIFGIPHPVRNCAYAESIAVIAAGKGAEEAVRRQMNRYRDEGFPANHGLIETNFMIFNLHHPKIGAVLEDWRSELRNETRRDQLSLNYVLWKNRCEWFPIMCEGHSLRDHPDFAYMGHGRNSGLLPIV